MNRFIEQIENWLVSAVGVEHAEMLMPIMIGLAVALLASLTIFFGYKAFKKDKPAQSKEAGGSATLNDQPVESLPRQDAPESKKEDKPPAQPVEVKVSLKDRLREGLSRTGGSLGALLLGKAAIDDDLLEELETLLLMADVGVEVTTEIIEKLADGMKRTESVSGVTLREELKKLLLEMLQPCEQSLDKVLSGAGDGSKTKVILVVGVNGVGKTTTIGKMAKRFQEQGRSVMLAAGDTFRAAAVEQLQTWGERHNVPVVAQHTGADSASVIFDALQSAQSKGVDVVIADTAGRLHNKSNLMDELKKVTRVMNKLDEQAPHEVLLVLDGGTGQNALAQMHEFHSAVNVTGVALTKLDGTAKGGVIFPLCKKFSVPVRYIGVGEAAEDLQVFSAADFIDALFDSDSVEDSNTGLPSAISAQGI